LLVDVSPTRAGSDSFALMISLLICSILRAIF